MKKNETIEKNTRAYPIEREFQSFIIELKSVLPMIFGINKKTLSVLSNAFNESIFSGFFVTVDIFFTNIYLK